MSLDSAERQATHTSPHQIAHNPLFTAREKIALLHELKAEVTGEKFNTDTLEFEPSEIDEAIAEVQQDAADGVGSSIDGGRDGIV